ncbi:MAG: helix-turn-helix transcriptional regulator [Pseudomonadota bacterium]
MRQIYTSADEAHFLIRSLSVDYVAGASEAEHSHPWPQLLYTQRGAVRAELNGYAWIIPPRRALWIPAHEPHALFMSSELELRTLYFRPGLLDHPTKHVAFNVTGLLHEAIVRVCDSGWLDDRQEVDRALSTIILKELNVAPPAGHSLVLPVDRKARQLANVLLADVERKLSLEEACSMVGISRRTAERKFRNQAGLSPAQWVRRARLSDSLIQIAGGATIEQASITAGYQSRSSFSEAFKKVFGFPPGETR